MGAAAPPRWNRIELSPTDHVAVLPRDYRFTLGGRAFLPLGGAPSPSFSG